MTHYQPCTKYSMGDRHGVAAQILFILCSKYSTFMQIASHCSQPAQCVWVTKWLLKGGGTMPLWWQKLIRIVIWNFIDINFRQENIKVHIYLQTISGSLSTGAAATVPFFLEQELHWAYFVRVCQGNCAVLLLHARVIWTRIQYGDEMVSSLWNGDKLLNMEIIFVLPFEF